MAPISSMGGNYFAQLAAQRARKESDERDIAARREDARTQMLYGLLGTGVGAAVDIGKTAASDAIRRKMEEEDRERKHALDLADNARREQMLKLDAANMGYSQPDVQTRTGLLGRDAGEQSNVRTGSERDDEFRARALEKMAPRLEAVPERPEAPGRRDAESEQFGRRGMEQFAGGTTYAGAGARAAERAEMPSRRSQPEPGIARPVEQLNQRFARRDIEQLSGAERSQLAGLNASVDQSMEDMAKRARAKSALADKATEQSMQPKVEGLSPQLTFQMTKHFDGEVARFAKDPKASAGAAKTYGVPAGFEVIVGQYGKLPQGAVAIGPEPADPLKAYAAAGAPVAQLAYLPAQRAALWRASGGTISDLDFDTTMVTIPNAGGGVSTPTVAMLTSAELRKSRVQDSEKAKYIPLDAAARDAERFVGRANAAAFREAVRAGDKATAKAMLVAAADPNAKTVATTRFTASPTQAPAAVEGRKQQQKTEAAKAALQALGTAATGLFNTGAKNLAEARKTDAATTAKRERAVTGAASTALALGKQMNSDAAKTVVDLEAAVKAARSGNYSALGPETAMVAKTARAKYGLDDASAPAPAARGAEPETGGDGGLAEDQRAAEEHARSVGGDAAAMRAAYASKLRQLQAARGR